MARGQNQSGSQKIEFFQFRLLWIVRWTPSPTGELSHW
jgi:hypothetical protein